MTCIAIIEATKRALESDHKEKLIAFFEDKSKVVLHHFDIPPNSEMYNWSGEEWIQNLIQENPLITDDIIDDFDIWLNDLYPEYAIYFDFIGGYEIYELCGVFWRVNPEDREVVGPTIDRDFINGNLV